MNHHVKTIVISFDGLGTPDWEIMLQKPAFKAFMKQAAYCSRVRTVYPSLTYAAHASISTGLFPKRHGVVSNNLLQPLFLNHQDWYWYDWNIHGKTFYHAAKEKGMSVASFFWPVTSGADLDYNIPEIFANRIWRNQIAISLRYGTPKLVLEMVGRYGKYLLHGMDQPWLDTFTHRSATRTMKKYEPDLTLLHYVDLDHMRHLHGHDSKEAMEALDRLDQRLHDWLTLMKGEPVNWVILGDHSSIDESKAIRVNQLLAENGYLTPLGHQRVLRYKVIAQQAGGSCYLYGDKKYEAQVRALLEKLSAENGGCIERIFSAEEAAAMGADPNCLLMLEAAEGYLFQNEMLPPVVFDSQDPGKGLSEKERKLRQPKIEVATHGYSPDKPGYTTVFAMRQTGDLTGREKLAKGEVAASMCLVDEGPTIARLLGTSLPDADGRVMTEFFDCFHGQCLVKSPK